MMMNTSALFIFFCSVAGIVSAQELDGCFPNCIGMTGEDCKSHIRTASPDLKDTIYILPWDSMVTMDYRTDRVRIFVDENDMVGQRKPCRG